MHPTEPNDTKPKTHAIIGAAFEVHRHLGYGFLEPVYQQALALEFTLRGIPFQREMPLILRYEGIELASAYRVDFMCYESILVEIKALGKLGPSEFAQVLHYLKASGIRLGLLINFGSDSMQIKRAVFDPKLRQAEQSVEDMDLSLL